MTLDDLESHFGYWNLLWAVIFKNAVYVTRRANSNNQKLHDAICCLSELNGYKICAVFSDIRLDLRHICSALLNVNVIQSDRKLR